MAELNFKDDVEAIEAFVEKYGELRREIGKVIVGQDEIIKNILMVMFSRSHALLIGVPGLAKTLMITTIAKSISLSYNRIQFTPDLMPSDIMGTEILDESRKFKFVKVKMSSVQPAPLIRTFLPLRTNWRCPFSST